MTTRLVTFADRTVRRIDGARAAVGTDRSDALTVTVPAGTPDADVQRAVRDHYGAICRWVKHDEAVDAWQPVAKEFVAGEGFLLKGRSCRFRWGAGPGASFDRDGFGGWLEVDASLRGDDTAVRQAVIDCYGLKSAEVALTSARGFVSRTGVGLPLASKVTERDRAWVATRSGKSGLTFEVHWALAQFSLMTVDYLVARALTARPDVRASLETLVPCPWQPRRRFHNEARNVWCGLVSHKESLRKRADIRNVPASTSGTEVHVTDTNDRLRDIAEYVRTVAATAANDQPDDRMVCWTFERIGGHERVIQFRKYPEGDDHEIVALPAESGVAEHIATWDPRVAEAVATLLDVIADPAVGAPIAVHQYALRLAELLDEGRA